MEKEIFSLEPVTNSRTIKIIQIIFGILCIAIAVFWIVFNIRSVKANGTLWITTFFLIGFGVYEILAGAGKTAKFIDISRERIILKQNSVLPRIEMKATDIEKTELYPLSIVFFLKSKRKIIFRFGLNYTEIIAPVKDRVAEFSDINNIPSEFKTEEL